MIVYVYNGRMQLIYLIEVKVNAVFLTLYICIFCI